MNSVERLNMMLADGQLIIAKGALHKFFDLLSSLSDKATAQAKLREMLVQHSELLALVQDILVSEAPMRQPVVVSEEAWEPVLEQEGAQATQ